MIPAIQFEDHDDNKQVLTVLESSSSSEVPAQVAQVQFGDLPASEDTALGPEGTSSLRIKLKNRMSSTLASMKSSSSLRDKAKAQQQSSVSDNPSSQSAASIKSTERRQSAFVTFSSSTEEPQAQQQQGTTSNVSTSTTSGSGKNRQSKTFWTFPRVRLEPGQGSKRQPNSFDTLAAASTAQASAKASAAGEDNLVVEDITMRSIQTELTAEDGATSLHEQLEDLKVEELDSDQSLDIILPGDYEDYTQFAELPLKKRKKLERSLAAAAAAAANSDQPNKRDSSVRAGADAMKRFLTLQRKETSTTIATTTTVDGDATEEVVTERDLAAPSNSKKRPPSSTEAKGSMAKRTGQQASEWRRSIMKSLHIGKNQQGSSKSTAAGASSQAAIASLGAITENAQGSDTAAVVEPTRPSRSDSVVSIRSRSLTTSTHPALLATTVAKPRTPGLRRETLEMAMRRRRQSSVARSNISDTDISPHLPRSSDFFNLENYSSTNVTHTFTSFTLELADMYAREVVNNSATPGLFNFKSRPSRLTVSSHVGMDIDTDQDFRGFDSDGDAISGYTGDADISMEEIHYRPKTPTTPRPSPSLFKTRTRESNATPTDMYPRRKISSVDGDSDTVSELPSLMIRTRDLNRSSGGGGGYSSKPRPVSGSSFEMDYDQQGAAGAAEASSPRSPRRTGAMSSYQRKTSRGGMMTLNSVAEGGSSASDSSAPVARSPRGSAPMSLEEVVSWKPRNMYSQQQQNPRPFVPALDTKPLKPTRGSGLSSSTTLVPSSRTPHSAAFLSQSPRALSPAYETLDHGVVHHQQFSSSSSSYRQHPNHPSADTLVPGHLKNGSNMSTSSGYSGRTLSGYGQQLRRGITTMEVEEFDPSEDFPPNTPADLKSLDFEALLATAEREHQKGWDDLKLQKKVPGQPIIPPVFDTLSPHTSSSSSSSQPSTSSPTFSPIQPLKITSSASKANRQFPSSSQQLAPPQRSAVAFDLGPSDDGGTGTGTGTGSDRSMRSKRIMKKKMSVIRLTGNGNGNIQGRREDDGVIRVSMSPTPYSPSNSPSPLMMHREREVAADSTQSSTSRSYSQQQQWRQ
ncbi:hypothetical protein BGZ96_011239 [Linnemannia gamsii]|uniref:Uncharacterized protein n=1 Tax=Linnemannia gamsii TaxID=64522 RepID=A0ABQ7KE99_9FUNG|nr:hypothetical protein BGZ96_011239 [Linnemannia gamsii]